MRISLAREKRPQLLLQQVHVYPEVISQFLRQEIVVVLTWIYLHSTARVLLVIKVCSALGVAADEE
jgi:hypothetical protein